MLNLIWGLTHRSAAADDLKNSLGFHDFWNRQTVDRQVPSMSEKISTTENTFKSRP